MARCLQVSTVSSTARGTTSSCVAANRFCSKDYNNKHLHFQPLSNVNGVRSLSSSSSSSFHLTPKTRLTSRIVCKAEVSAVKVVTEATWKTEVIGSSTLVLVDFWAPWCGPCRMIAPVIDELAKEYAGKISCYKLNTDESAAIASEYGIRSIPTVLFFKNGEKKESVIGAVPKSTLTASIEKYLVT